MENADVFGALSYTAGLLTNNMSLMTTMDPVTNTLEYSSHAFEDKILSTSTIILDTPTSSASIEQTIYWIRIGYTPVLVVLGTVANIITSIATMRSVLRKLSSSHYLCAISLVNSLYLIMLLLKWLTELGYNVYHRPIMCQLTDMLCNISSFLSIWITVALCVDRYIAISWPPESPKMCTVIRARIVITLMVVISLIIYLNTSLTVGVVESSRGPLCVPLPMPFRKIPSLRLLEIIVNHAIPFAATGILLSLIVNAIYKSHRGLNPLFQSDNSHLRHTTVVYFTAFLLFQVPADALKTAFFINREFIKSDLQEDKSHVMLHFQLWLFVAEYLAHTGMAMNLVLLTTSYPLFRQSLKQTMASCTKSLFKMQTCFCCVKRIDEESENMQLKEGCHNSGRSVEVCTSLTQTKC